MKIPDIKFIAGCLLGVPFLALSQVAAKASPEHLQARARYELELAVAAKPIKARYVTELQSLQRMLTQKGDLPGALTVQAILAKLTTADGKPLPVTLADSRFSGTAWDSDAGDSRIEFKANGQFHEKWGAQVFQGTWKPVAELEVEVMREDRPMHFTMSLEKDTPWLWRKEPGCGWHVAK